MFNKQLRIEALGPLP